MLRVSIGALHKINDRLERILKIFSSGSDFCPLFSAVAVGREGDVSVKLNRFQKESFFFWTERRDAGHGGDGGGIDVEARISSDRAAVKHHY